MLGWHSDIYETTYAIICLHSVSSCLTINNYRAHGLEGVMYYPPAEKRRKDMSPMSRE